MRNCATLFSVLKNLLTPGKLTLAGVLILIFGFFYHALVFIPPQDPPPEVQAAYAAKVLMAERIYLVGWIALALGIGLYLWRRVFK